MKEINEQFSTPSVQQWMEKAEKELKGKALDDLSWNLDNNLTFSPLFFDRKNTESLQIPARQSNWVIGDKYTIFDPKMINQQLLTALNMGLEGVHLQLSAALDLAQWAQLLDQIVLTYITLIIDARSLSAKDLIGLAAYLQDSTTKWNKDQLILLTKDRHAYPAVLEECIYEAATFPITDSQSVQQCAQHLHQAANRLHAILETKGTPNRLLFQLILSSNFYLNIIYTQALGILWQNILDANGCDPHSPIYIQANIVDTGKLDENTQKINATAQAISAAIAGVDYIQIATSSKVENQDFNRRINRNIQHLLKLESFMDYVENPSEGAYYFDNLTKDFAEQVWTAFVEM